MSGERPHGQFITLKCEFTTAGVVTAETKITHGKFVQKCNELALVPKNTVFIFPSNEGHHTPSTTLYSVKSGGGLGVPAGILGNKQIPVLGLPTRNSNSEKNEIPKEMSRNAVADIWKAIGAGYNIALPVRDAGTGYFKSSFTDGTEPCFWGENVTKAEADSDLAEYYLKELSIIKAFMAGELTNPPTEFAGAYSLGQRVKKGEDSNPWFSRPSDEPQDKNEWDVPQGNKAAMQEKGKPLGADKSFETVKPSDSKPVTSNDAESEDDLLIAQILPLIEKLSLSGKRIVRNDLVRSINFEASNSNEKSIKYSESISETKFHGAAKKIYEDITKMKAPHGGGVYFNKAEVKLPDSEQSNEANTEISFRSHIGLEYRHVTPVMWVEKALKRILDPKMNFDEMKVAVLSFMEPLIDYKDLQEIFDTLKDPNSIYDISGIEDLIKRIVVLYNTKSYSVNMNDSYLIIHGTEEHHISPQLKYYGNVMVNAEGNLVKAHNYYIEAYNFIASVHQLVDQGYGDTIKKVLNDESDDSNKNSMIRKGLLRAWENISLAEYKNENKGKKVLKNEVIGILDKGKGQRLSDQDIEKIAYGVYGSFDFLPVAYTSGQGKNTRLDTKSNSKNRYVGEPVERLYALAATHLQIFFINNPALEEQYGSEIFDKFLKYVANGTKINDFNNMALTTKILEAQINSDIKQRIEEKEKKEKEEKYTPAQIAKMAEDRYKALFIDGFASQYPKVDGFEKKLKTEVKKILQNKNFLIENKFVQLEQSDLNNSEKWSVLKPSNIDEVILKDGNFIVFIKESDTTNAIYLIKNGKYIKDEDDETPFKATINSTAETDPSEVFLLQSFYDQFTSGFSFDGKSRGADEELSEFLESLYRHKEILKDPSILKEVLASLGLIENQLNELFKQLDNLKRGDHSEEFLAMKLRSKNTLPATLTLETLRYYCILDFILEKQINVIGLSDVSSRLETQLSLMQAQHICDKYFDFKSPLTVDKLDGLIKSSEELQTINFTEVKSALEKGKDQVVIKEMIISLIFDDIQKRSMIEVLPKGSVNDKKEAVSKTIPDKFAEGEATNISDAVENGDWAYILQAEDIACPAIQLFKKNPGIYFSQPLPNIESKMIPCISDGNAKYVKSDGKVEDISQRISIIADIIRQVNENKKVISVINVDTNHWAAFMLLKHDGKLLVYYKDSLGKGPGEFSNAEKKYLSDASTTEYLRSHFKQLFEIIANALTLPVEFRVGTGREQLETDLGLSRWLVHCGIFALKNMEVFANLTLQQISDNVVPNFYNPIEGIEDLKDAPINYTSEINAAREKCAALYAAFWEEENTTIKQPSKAQDFMDVEGQSSSIVAKSLPESPASDAKSTTNVSIILSPDIQSELERIDRLIAELQMKKTQLLEAQKVENNLTESKSDKNPLKRSAEHDINPAPKKQQKVTEDLENTLDSKIEEMRTPPSEAISSGGATFLKRKLPGDSVDPDSAKRFKSKEGGYDKATDRADDTLAEVDTHMNGNTSKGVVTPLAFPHQKAADYPFDSSSRKKEESEMDVLKLAQTHHPHLHFTYFLKDQTEIEFKIASCESLDQLINYFKTLPHDLAIHCNESGFNISIQPIIQNLENLQKNPEFSLYHFPTALGLRDKITALCNPRESDGRTMKEG